MLLRTIGFLVLLVSAAASVLSAYSVLYFGWVSATPLTSEQLERVQRDYIVWLAVLICSVLATAVIAVWLFWLLKRVKRRMKPGRIELL